MIKKQAEWARRLPETWISDQCGNIEKDWNSKRIQYHENAHQHPTELSHRLNSIGEIWMESTADLKRLTGYSSRSYLVKPDPNLLSQIQDLMERGSASFERRGGARSLWSLSRKVCEDQQSSSKWWTDDGTGSGHQYSVPMTMRNKLH